MKYLIIATLLLTLALPVHAADCVQTPTGDAMTNGVWNYLNADRCAAGNPPYPWASDLAAQAQSVANQRAATGDTSIPPANTSAVRVWTADPWNIWQLWKGGDPVRAYAIVWTERTGSGYVTGAMAHAYSALDGADYWVAVMGQGVSQPTATAVPTMTPTVTLTPTPLAPTPTATVQPTEPPTLTPPPSTDTPTATPTLPPPTPTLPPTTWVHCANEGEICAYSGIATVRYGAKDVYAERVLMGPVPCTNEVFGDPLPYVAKSCDVDSASVTVPTATATPSPTATAVKPTATVTATQTPAPCILVYRGHRWRCA